MVERDTSWYSQGLDESGYMSRHTTLNNTTFNGSYLSTDDEDGTMTNGTFIEDEVVMVSSLVVVLTFGKGLLLISRMTDAIWYFDLPYLNINGMVIIQSKKCIFSNIILHGLVITDNISERANSVGWRISSH